MRRKLLFVVILVLASGALLIPFLPRVPLATATSPQRVDTRSDGFESSTSRLAAAGGSLSVSGADGTGLALALHPVEVAEAAELPVLRYALDSATAGTRAIFVWVSEGQLRSAALPETASGRGTMLLSAESGWQGRIDAIGLGLMPVDYLAGAALTESEFRIEALALESGSYRAARDALLTQWTALRPWSGRSINTGGFELGVQPPPSLQAYLAGVAALALLLSWACFGRDRLRRSAGVVLAATIALLALVQFAQLAARAADARAAAAQVRERPDLPLAASPPLAQEARALSHRLREQAGRARVLVLGESRFLREHTTWLLREHDVATLDAPMPLPEGVQLDGAYLVLAGAPGFDDGALAVLAPEARGLRREAQATSDTLRVWRLSSSGGARP